MGARAKGSRDESSQEPSSHEFQTKQNPQSKLRAKFGFQGRRVVGFQGGRVWFGVGVLRWGLGLGVLRVRPQDR